MGSIGDVVRALPIAHILKNSYPQLHLGWLIEPKCQDLLKGNNYIDKTYVFQRSKGILAVREILKQIRQDKYELVLDLQRHLKSGLFSYFSGAENRVGFARKNSKEFNWIFNNKYIPFRSEKTSKLEHYLDFPRFLGILLPNKLQFCLDLQTLSKEINSEISRHSGKLIGFVLGSTWETKDWKFEGYLKVAQRFLAESKCGIVLLGDKTKSEMAEKLFQALGSERVSNLVNKTTISELISIIKRFSFLIGPDSGPGHMAAALAVPYISLFGPTNPERVAPYQMESLVIKSNIACSPCNRRVCPGLNNICMRLISPDIVFLKGLSLLSQEDSL